MFYETAANFQTSFFPFSLYPPIHDRESWEALDEDWKRETVKLGERYLHFSYPYLSATDFLDFTRTGNRVRYEDKLFSKRQALGALVLAECVENKGRFIDDIVNGIYAICDESAWQLPAHNSYIRDTPQLPLPDTENPVLDLFAAETGSVLGCTCYLLKTTLEQISPFITKRMMQELSARIFTPYLNHHFWWMGGNGEFTNNWTVWCTQNVLHSVFLADTDETLRRSVFLKACQSIDYFLEEYGNDGCCDEGASYYRHAGLCLFNTTDFLNAVTNNAFCHLYQNRKIRNIASYIMNVHVKDKYYVNFADCSPVAGRAGVREYLFARKTENRDMAAFAAADYMAGLPGSLTLPNENNLYYRLQNGFTAREIKSASQNNTTAIAYPDIYYPSTGLFIARDDRLLLAVKAGDNADSHNHNDTGSFTVYKDGNPLFIDIGVESYTKKTFSPQRYDIWTMQSAYHNLPTINGCMQQDGEAYSAQNVCCEFSDTVCEISMDIARAYPQECGVSFYRRTASLIKGQEILIRDCFPPVKDSVILSFMTYEKPVYEKMPDGFLFHIGTLGTMRLTGGTTPVIEEIPISDTRLKTAWEHEVYRIRVAASATEIEIHIS